MKCVSILRATPGIAPFRCSVAFSAATSWTRRFCATVRYCIPMPLWRPRHNQMVHRLRLQDDAGSDRREQCPPYEEPESAWRECATDAGLSAHTERDRAD